MNSVAYRFLHSDARRYGFAVVAMLLALAVQHALTLLLGDHNPYHALWAAVVLSAWYCGIGASILAVVIGLLGVWLWFTPVSQMLISPDRGEIYGMFGFAFFSAFIIALGESHRREAERRVLVEKELRNARTDLEERVLERTAELNAANLSLHELPGRLLEVQDQERRRIARELHDTTGQTLAAVKMVLAKLEGTLVEKQWSEQFFGELNDLIDQALKEVRTTSYLLHPPLLDEAGLVSAINWYVDGFSQRSGLKVILELPQNSLRLPERIELAVFRVLQESLTNVHRHAGCSAVVIHLDLSVDHLRLSVCDNGCGIPQDRIRRFSEHGAGFGVGIAGMRERIRELDGQLTVTSGGSGTSLTATVPLAVSSRMPTQIQTAKSA
jgi:signal transduction histidine kinase